MRNKLLLLALFILTMASHFVGANAQSQYGILYNGKNVQNEMSIAADPSQTFNFAASLPGLTYSSLKWTAEGGVEIVGSPNGSSVSVRSKSGTTNAEEYSRYAKGRLRLVAEVDTTIIPPGCESCEWGQLSKAFGYEVLIYKTFDWSGNSIVGPSCVNPGDSVTYSVAPWASLHCANEVGFDDYYWDIPDSLLDSELYYSADKSSVTFVVSENIEGQTIKARIGKYNCADETLPQTPLTLTLGNEVPEPVIDGMVNKAYCLPFGVESATLTVTNASPEATYNWDLRSWEVTGTNQNGSSITFTPQNNEQAIKLVITGGCSEKTFIYDINRSLPEDYAITNSSTDPSCLPPNHLSNFYVENVPIGTEMNWTVSGPGWSISDIESVKASPRIRVGTEVGIVTARCSRCPATSVADTFYVATGSIGEISGEDCLAPGDTSSLTYSVEPVSGADHYEWSYPIGWTHDGNVTGNSITLIPDGESVGSVRVIAVGCDHTIRKSLQVKMTKPAPDGITVEDCINVGTTGTVTLSVNEDASVAGTRSYEWTIPNSFGSVAAFGANKRSVTVNTTGNVGNHSIRVQQLNSCGSAALDTVVTLTQRMSFVVANNVPRWWYFYSDDLPYEELPEGYATVWAIDGVVNPDQNNLPDLMLPKSSLTSENVVSVTVTYPDGCSEVYEFHMSDYISANKSLSMDSDLSDLSEPIKIYPNPANSRLNVELPAKDKYCISIFSLSGNRILNIRGEGKSCNIDVSSIPRGEYICYVRQSKVAYGRQISIYK